MISQGCTLCIKSGSMVLCKGPARGWGRPHSIGPRRAVLAAAKGGCWFSGGCPRTPCPTRVKKFFDPAVKNTAGALGGGADRFIYARQLLLEFHLPSKSGPESQGHREGEVVVKPNTAGGSVGRARCRHRKVVQNPPSVQADTHDYFLRRPKAGRLHPSSKSGPDMIISCSDLRLVCSPRHRKVVQNPHSVYYTRSRLSIDCSFELHSSRNVHDPSFMALALIVSEKMTLMQKLDENLQSQRTEKSWPRLNTDGSFELYSSRCMHDHSFMAPALIVSEKMT